MSLATPLRRLVPAPERILGVDPGSRFTGYGVIDKAGNSLRFVAAGRIQAGSGPLVERLEIIFTELRALIGLHAPTTAAMEGIFHHRNADSALKLGHARGVALLACRLHQLEIGEYSPSVVKQAVVGHGAALKEQVQQMVRMMLGIPTVALSLDASDALAVAICHAHRNPQLAKR